jgi:hypothetical protein
MVLRLDFYVGERDTYGLGFSDNVIFRKQYYLRAVLDEGPVVPTKNSISSNSGWRRAALKTHAVRLGRTAPVSFFGSIRETG